MCLSLHPAPVSAVRHRLCVPQSPGDTILVAGATGGIGQLVTAKLLEVCLLSKCKHSGVCSCRVVEELRPLPCLRYPTATCP